MNYKFLFAEHTAICYYATCRRKRMVILLHKLVVISLTIFMSLFYSFGKQLHLFMELVYVHINKVALIAFYEFSTGN